VEINEEQGKSRWKKMFNKKVVLITMALVVVVGIGAGVGLVKASDNPAFCTACHIMKPYYESWQNSSLLANKHSTEGVTCHQCHESSLSIQAEEGLKFVTGDYKTPLDKREFSKDMCLECHNFDEVKAKTNFDGTNPHDSHNGELECNTCHSMHQQSNAMCAECHAFEWIGKLDDNWNKK